MSSYYVPVHIYFWGIVDSDEPVTLGLISDATFSGTWSPRLQLRAN